MLGSSLDRQAHTTLVALKVVPKVETSIIRMAAGGACRIYILCWAIGWILARAGSPGYLIAWYLGAILIGSLRLLGP